MKFQRNNCLLYAITMPHRPGMRPLEEQVREALDAGITISADSVKNICPRKIFYGRRFPSANSPSAITFL
ncbi:MAG: hypothetical protein ACLTR6_07745 [Clostridium fessum]